MKIQMYFLCAAALGLAGAVDLRGKPAMLATNTAVHSKNATSIATGIATGMEASAETMSVTSKAFMKVELGPFPSASEACTYCFASFTKKGDPPAGPVAPFCVCMAYPSDGGHNMFCATPPSAAEYIAEKEGCRCKQHDMEAMGKDTCKPIE